MKIILTGGGTAGHVMPNIGLLPYLSDFEIHYVGTHDGIEKKLIEKQGKNVTYHEIRAGKFRRYFTLKNFSDIFNVIGGYFDSKKIIKEVKPDIVFSKGGFVSVPLVLAARGKKIPIITHESDITPGLANKIISKFATVVLTTFPETVDKLKKGKGKFVGSPIRDSLFEGSREKGLKYLGFSGEKPVVSVMGGSLGSVNLNNAVRNNLDMLLEKYDVVHMCGKDHVDESVKRDGYFQQEFIDEELSDVLAATDFMISRAGSNAINEFLALGIPMLLVPLGSNASRGDQILNAESFEKRNFAVVLPEDEITCETFNAKFSELLEKADSMRESMSKFDSRDGIKNIYNEIINNLNKGV